MEYIFSIAASMLHSSEATAISLEGLGSSSPHPSSAVRYERGERNVLTSPTQPVDHLPFLCLFVTAPLSARLISNNPRVSGRLAAHTPRVMA